MRCLNRILLVACSIVTGMGAARANNIEVTNTSLTPDGKVRFDLSWENSWRTNSGPQNWDAAWIFVKFFDADSGYWRHAHLAAGGHAAPTNTEISVGWVYPGLPANDSNWVVGAFLYRTVSIAGTDTLMADDVQLAWDYGGQNVCYDAIDSVKVFAIEMVYVRQGAFYLGSGGAEEGHFYSYPAVTSTFQVTGENQIPIGQASGNLYYTDSLVSDDHFGDHGGPLPAAFPKGFDDFYIMKYEIAQQDFVDFLNTLTRVQQDARTFTDLSPGVTNVTNRYVMRNNSNLSDRQGIRCDASIDANAPITFYCDLNNNDIGGEANDGQWVACNYLSWSDMAAYLDWCGLRPMTELEFVKAARGPQTPVMEEYVWGSTDLTQVGSLVNGGTISEGSGTAGANAVYGNVVGGGIRNGIFATSGTSRIQAGAGYYGAMDLGGNLWERVVSLGRPLGRAFSGTLGNGDLAPSGGTDVPTWPPDSYGGSGLIGGNWYDSANYLRTSDRNTAAHTPGTRSRVAGGRGVRDAP